MSKVDLASKGWCDLVFEGRNKEYGAYRMRSRAGRRNLAALVILLIGIGVIGLVVAINVVVKNLTKNQNMQDETGVQLSQLKQEAPKKEEKKVEIKYDEPKVEKVKVKASIQFTVPKIESDNLVDETKEVKTQEKVTKSSISIAAQDYAGDGKGGINIDDLKDNQQAGGTSAPPKQEEVLANELVEVQATYPGGEAALLKFISDNLVYPAIAQEQELQGTVVLRFRVEKDGSVGQIVVRKSLSRECDQAAAKVVSKLHRFTPAKQQGHPVPVWFTLPIRFRIQ